MNLMDSSSGYEDCIFCEMIVFIALALETVVVSLFHPVPADYDMLSRLVDGTDVIAFHRRANKWTSHHCRLKS